MDLRQTLSFDAAGAISALNALNNALAKTTQGLNNFAAAARKLNTVTGQAKLGQYSKNIEAVNAATSKVASTSSKASEALSTVRTRVDAAHGSMGRCHIATAKLGAGFGTLAGMGKLVSGVLLGQLAFRAISAVIQSFQQAFSEAVKLGNALAEVQTIGQNMVGSYDVLTQKVYALSNAFGLSAQVTAEGLYQTLSNQVVAAGNSFEFLSVAQGLATVTASSTEDAVNALSSVMNVYGQEAGSAYVISSKLAKTVELGRLRLGEMANSLGKVYPLAHALGISFEEVMAALATMTRQGTKANVSITQLRGVFLKLVKPSKELQEIFHKWGVESGQQAIQTFGGLGGVIRKLSAETGASSTEMAKLFSRVRAMSGALAINTKEGKMYAEILQQISAESEFLNEALKKMSEAPARKLTLAFNELKNEMAKMMGNLIPLVTEIVKGITAVIKVVNNAISAFKEAYGNIQEVGQALEELANSSAEEAFIKIEEATDSAKQSLNDYVDRVPHLRSALERVGDFGSYIWDLAAEGVESVKQAFNELYDYLMSYDAINYIVSASIDTFNAFMTTVKTLGTNVGGIFVGLYRVLEPILTWIADTLGWVVPPVKLLVEAVEYFGGASEEAAGKLSNFNSELQQFNRGLKELQNEQAWKQYWADFKTETENSLKVLASWSRAWDASPDHVGRVISEIILELELLSETAGTEAKDMEDALTQAFEGPKKSLEILTATMTKTEETLKDYKRSLALSKETEAWKKANMEAAWALSDMRAAVDVAMSKPVNTKEWKKAADEVDKQFNRAIKSAEKLEKEGKTQLAAGIRNAATSRLRDFKAGLSQFTAGIKAEQAVIDSVPGRLAKLNFKKMVSSLEQVKKDIVKGVQNLANLSAEQRTEAVDGMIRKIHSWQDELLKISKEDWEIMAKINPKLITKTLAGLKESIAIEAVLEAGTGEKLNDAIKQKIGEAYKLVVELQGEEAGQNFLAMVKTMTERGVITSSVQLDPVSMRKADSAYNTWQKKMGENKQLTQTLSEEFGKIKTDWLKTLDDMGKYPSPKLYIDYGALDQLPAKGKERMDQLWAMVQTAKERIDATVRSGEPIKVFDLNVLQKSVEELIRTDNLTLAQVESLRALSTQSNLVTNSQSNYNAALSAGVQLSQEQASKIGIVAQSTGQVAQQQNQVNASLNQAGAQADTFGNKIGLLPGRVDAVNAGLQKTATTDISAPLNNFTASANTSASSVGNLQGDLKNVNNTNITQPFTGFSQGASSSISLVSSLIAELNIKISQLVTGPMSKLVSLMANLDSGRLVESSTAVGALNTILGSVVPQLSTMVEHLAKSAISLDAIGAFVPPDLSKFITAWGEIKGAVESVVTVINKSLIPAITAIPGKVALAAEEFDKITKAAGSCANSITKCMGTAFERVRKAIESLKTPIHNVGTTIGRWPGIVARIYPAIRTAITLMKQLKQAALEALQAAKNAASASSGSHARYGRYFASGGFNRGQDTIPAQLSKGEFVVNASATRKFYSELVAMNAGAKPAYRNEGGNTTTVGDIHVHVNHQESERQTVRSIATELKREIRRGTIRL